jgi:asparagine synthase (glutamine-hydrolysing)
VSEPRFLALSGSDPAIRDLLRGHFPKKDRPARLNRRLDRPGLVIFTSPETPVVPLQDGMGLVVGRLFRRTGERVATLGPADSKAAATSSGHRLVRDFWGNYVAFLVRGDHSLIVRDPSAAIPAYARECGEIQFACSHLELAASLVGDANVDPEFLRQWLSFPFLRSSRTGLLGWSELLPGMSRAHDGGTEPLWTPWHHDGGTKDNLSMHSAAASIRDSAMATIAALVADAARPVLELSGGLDSSIVAACLHRAGIAFEAVNFVTRMPDGDERHYARIVARHLGVRLAELPEDGRPLQFAPPPAALFRPGLSPVLQPLERARRAFAAANAGTTFITGAGGDNIFCYLGTAAPILDSFSARGLAAALRTAQDVAELGECTVFKALRFAARKSAQRFTWRRWARDWRFLSVSAMAQRPDPHPWLAIPAGTRAGSIEHVKSIVRAQHFLSSEYAFGDPVRHPLLNQPLMEACLSIPSWLWVKHGRNRSAARAAFADLLPEEIIQRRTKGRLESMCARSFQDNRLPLAALLLEGELDRRGLIDRPAIEAYLKRGGEPGDENYFRIFDLASLELWLRSWRS